jgi:hypothetical protein
MRACDIYSVETRYGEAFVGETGGKGWEIHHLNTTAALTQASGHHTVTLIEIPIPRIPRSQGARTGLLGSTTPAHASGLMLHVAYRGVSKRHRLSIPHHCGIRFSREARDGSR